MGGIPGTSHAHAPPGPSSDAVRKWFLRGAVVRAAARSACGVTGARRYPRGHEALQRLWFLTFRPPSSRKAFRLFRESKTVCGGKKITISPANFCPNASRLRLPPTFSMLLGHCDARSLHVLGLSRWSTWTRPHRSRLTRTTWTPPACLTGLCAKPRPRCSAGPLASSAWWSDARTSTTTRRSSARPRRWGSSTCGWWTRWCAGRTAGSAPAVTLGRRPPPSQRTRRSARRREAAEAASAVSRTARTGARRTSSSRVARRSSPRSASFQTLRPASRRSGRTGARSGPRTCRSAPCL